MKYQHSYAKGIFTNSGLLQYPSIARKLRRFCIGLTIWRALFLAIFFLPSAESIAAKDHAKHEIEMIAEEIEDGLLAYRMVEHHVDGVNITSRYSKQATVPGPTIILTEGDKVRLTIRNGVTLRPDQQISVHVHGVHYTILSDGTLKIINN